MPIGLVTAYAEQIAQLQAEESLRSIQAQVAASGNMAKPDLRRYLRGLQREAQGGRQRRQRAKPANTQQLASMKIKTVEGGEVHGRVSR